jgi:hypothetical protein
LIIKESEARGRAARDAEVAAALRSDDAAAIGRSIYDKGFAEGRAARDAEIKLVLDDLQRYVESLPYLAPLSFAPHPVRVIEEIRARLAPSAKGRADADAPGNIGVLEDGLRALLERMYADGRAAVDAEIETWVSFSPEGRKALLVHGFEAGRAAQAAEISAALKADAAHIRSDLVARLFTTPNTAVLRHDALKMMNDATAGALEGWAEWIAEHRLTPSRAGEDG